MNLPELMRNPHFAFFVEKHNGVYRIKPKFSKIVAELIDQENRFSNSDLLRMCFHSPGVVLHILYRRLFPRKQG